MSASILSLENVGKTFGRGLRRKGQRAVDGVSLEVGRGSVFGLLGPNGAGKTTLVKILLGLIPRYDGRARLFGEPVGRPVPRRRVGYLPEAHRLPPHLTGRQVLMLFGMMCGRERAWLRARVPVWLEKVGMERDADRKVREYSKGMQQRIGLAQALVHEPELVFLDEPTDGVDPLGRAAIRGIVQDLKAAGVTVFVNSHLLMEVELVCDRVVIMDRGRILRAGSIEELTPATGGVRIRLGALPDDLERLLAGVADVAGGLVRGETDFELRGLGAAELDAVIDRLRAAGCSIRAIEPRRLTLEEAFIEEVRGAGRKAGA